MTRQACFLASVLFLVLSLSGCDSYSLPDQFAKETFTLTPEKTSFTDQRYTAGGAIGRIRLQAIDAAGKTASATVLVLPPAPTSFAVDFRNTNSCTLSWSYADASISSGFSLEWTPATNGGFSNLPSTSFSTTVPAQNNTTYTYYLYAVSGAYKSLPAQFTSTP